MGPDLAPAQGAVDVREQGPGGCRLRNERRMIEDTAADEVRWVSPAERIEAARRKAEPEVTFGDYGERWIGEWRNSKGEPLLALTCKDYEQVLVTPLVPAAACSGDLFLAAALLLRRRFSAHPTPVSNDVPRSDDAGCTSNKHKTDQEGHREPIKPRPIGDDIMDYQGRLRQKRETDSEQRPTGKSSTNRSSRDSNKSQAQDGKPIQSVVGPGILVHSHRHSPKEPQCGQPKAKDDQKNTSPKPLIRIVRRRHAARLAATPMCRTTQAARPSRRPETCASADSSARQGRQSEADPAAVESSRVVYDGP